mmetsp:Transcript_123065/g.359289  ORF Transcript_123065/g.359289 Transcript_123065/m.359289 type:complete len:101 (-) Transcript_123065:970-1272(-)
MSQPWASQTFFCTRESSGLSLEKTKISLVPSILSYQADHELHLLARQATGALARVKEFVSLSPQSARCTPHRPHPHSSQSSLPSAAAPGTTPPVPELLLV